MKKLKKVLSRYKATTKRNAKRKQQQGVNAWFDRIITKGKGSDINKEQDTAKRLKQEQANRRKKNVTKHHTKKEK